MQRILLKFTASPKFEDIRLSVKLQEKKTEWLLKYSLEEDILKPILIMVKNTDSQDVLSTLKTFGCNFVTCGRGLWLL